MSLTLPITFATRTGEVQLSYLDENFTYLKTQLDTTNTSLATLSDSVSTTISSSIADVASDLSTLQTQVDNITLLSLSTSETHLSGAGGVLDKILPSGEVSGYVLTTTGAGSYQWAAAPSSVGVVGTKIDTQRQTFTATANQTVFTLSTITYTPGSGQLRVYIDGVRQFPVAYTETSTSVFTLTTGVTAGVLVLAEIDGYVSYPIPASAINYTPAGGSTIEATTVQNAISELETEKAGISSPTITTPTIATIKSTAVNTLTAFQDSAGTAVGCLARAWANFDGTLTGTITPRANFNMSSITKSGTGTYTGNFTNALPNANYASAGSNLPTSIGNVTNATHTNTFVNTASSVNIQHRAGGNTSSIPADVNQMSVIVFG